MKSKFKETEIGKIPEDWEVERLCKLGDVKTGKGTKKSNFGKYKIIGSNGILGYTDDEEFLESGPLIFTGRVGTIGQINHISKQKVWLSDNTLYFKTDDENLLNFIYYFLRAYDFSSLNVGSTQPLVKQSDFKKLLIALPKNKQELKFISKILSNLDFKIELNQRMNKTFEAIGQVIFKHWFVDFEFPNEEGKPYKSSGGEMVDSELGKIPKGWKVSTLREFITVERGVSYKGSGLTEHGLPMINLANFAPNHGFINSATKPYSGEYKERNLVKASDIVIANTDITQKRDVLGSPAIVPNLESEKILFTHHVYAVRNKSWIPNYFIYYLLQLKQYEARTRGFATGTTVLFLPDDAILDFQFVLSNKELVGKFVSIMKIFQDRLNLNTSEHITLTMLRDSLLPKLMSGKIRVPVEVK